MANVFNPFYDRLLTSLRDRLKRKYWYTMPPLHIDLLVVVFRVRRFEGCCSIPDGSVADRTKRT